MKIEIKEYEKVYSFELVPITQLCGQNIVKKTYILESLRKYFGTYKYQEGEDKWRDNIKIDGNIVGRKYFTVLSIRNTSDIINLIKCSKQSLMMEYLKQVMQNFELQQHMEKINVELDEIFRILNDDVNKLGEVELDYSMSDVWDIVQKSDVGGKSQNKLENLGNFELIDIMINLIENVMNVNPRKEVVIFENIDHILSIEQYTNLVNRLKILTRKYDIFFVMTTSLDRYVECDDDIFSGIAIFGDTDFQMPDINYIAHFIRDSYPCNKKMDNSEIKDVLKKIVQNIGQKKYLCSIEENVICKMINQTLMMCESDESKGTAPEIAFLKS